MEIGPVAAELFYVDGQRDRRRNRHDETKSRFRNFANALIKVQGLEEVREEALYIYIYIFITTIINWQ